MSEPRPVIEIKGVSKRFDATQALSDVSLSLRPGEIHSLVGENGAGKSTLIKIMTGLYPADSGEMTLGGEPYAPRSSADAQRQGIAAIYQEPSVFPDLSVAENIFIGHQDQGKVVDWSTMYREASRILSKLDIEIDPRLPAAGLTVAGQQAVEIAKGDLPRRAGPDHGRAHGRPLRPRSRPSLSSGAKPEGVRRRRPLHHASSRGALRHIGPDLCVP